MAKHKRRMLSGADGLSGGKKAKRKAPKGFKIVGKKGETPKACYKRTKNRLVLKKGCKWGRGAYRGKLLKATTR